MKFELYRNILLDCGVELSSENRILDFGCGAGGFVSEGLAAGYNIVGCDFDAHGDHLSPIEFPYRLPYPDEHFDVLVSNTVMEHVMNYGEVLAEHRRVLKPGGAFLHSFPARWIPIEPHTFVPLGTVVRNRPWLAFWATLGVRNRWLAGIPRLEVARRYHGYLRDHTNYLPTGKLLSTMREHFDEVRFVESAFLRNSPNSRGRRLSALSSILPFVPHVYRALWNRVIFGRR